jgi:glycosyltransferase involved in cell wall biosynthesis
MVAGYRRVLNRLLPRKPALILRDLGRIAHGHLHGLRVVRAAHEHHADLVIETQVGFASSNCFLSPRTGTPLILDDCSPSSEERTLGSGLPGLAAATLRRQAQFARVVVAVSSAARGALVAEGIPEDKVWVVPNGVDVDAFKRSRHPGVRQEARSRFGFRDDEIILGFSGSFQSWHRAELLVEAVARLRHHYPVRGMFVGDGPTYARALALALERGVDDRVIALGSVAPEEIPMVLSAWDVGLLPGSNFYGHPMKLVEYAAAGLACVAPDLPAIREELRADETGLLFREGDLESLCAVLALLITDHSLRKRLGQAGRESAFRSASWDQRARSLLRPLGL